MSEKTLTDHFVDYLKSIQETDPKLIIDLFKTRIECKSDLSSHPSLGYFYGTMNADGKLTDDPDDIPCIGILGLLNGFLCYMQNMNKNLPLENFGEFERILVDFEPEEIRNENYNNYKLMNTRDYRR